MSMTNGSAGQQTMALVFAEMDKFCDCMFAMNVTV
jgi:hypothetical protein